jgi:hypothetical protein
MRNKECLRPYARTACSFPLFREIPEELIALESDEKKFMGGDSGQD